MAITFVECVVSRTSLDREIGKLTLQLIGAILRPIFIILAVLPLVIPANQAFAQKIPQPGSRLEKEGLVKKGPRLVLPGDEKDKPQAKPTGAGLLGMTPRELSRYLTVLGVIPPGHSRAEEILENFRDEREEDVIKALTPVFRQAKQKEMRGAVRVLVDLKSPLGAVLLRQVLGTYKLKRSTKDILVAAMQLDPVGTRPFLFTCLENRISEVRRQAGTLLRGLVKASDLDALVALTRSTKVDTRQRALKFLMQVMPPGVEKCFITLLDDPSPACARRAAIGIANLATFPAQVGKRVAAGPGSGKSFSYALLAAIYADEKKNGTVLNPAWGPILQASLATEDPFLSALCAAALARLAYYSPDLTGKIFCEQKAMDRLVQVLTTKKFFSGYGEAAKVAERSARLLAGRRGRVLAAEWARWWPQERPVFAGNRARLPLEKAENRCHVVLVMADQVEAFVLRPAGVKWQGLVGAREVVVLPAEQDKLIAGLLAQGFFKNPAGWDEGMGKGLRVSLWLAGREYRLFAPVGDEGLAPVAKAVRDLLERNLWQLYAPEAEGLAKERWIDTQRDKFSAADAKERGRQLKDLVLARFPQLAGAIQVRGLGHLLSIPGIDKILTGPDITVMLAVAAKKPGIDRQVEAILEVVTMVDGPESWGQVLDFLAQRWAHGGQFALQRLLGQASSVRLNLAFQHSDLNIRCGAIRFIGNKKSAIWTQRLQDLLQDKEEQVRRTAIWSLAKLQDFSMVDRVLNLAQRDPSLAVRSSALLYLGASRESRALNLLISSLMHDELKLRIAAIKGLGRSRRPRAAEALAGILAADVQGGEGRLAGQQLTSWGGRAVREALRPLLNSPRKLVRKKVTQILAEILDPAVIPQLLVILREPEDKGLMLLARRALCTMSCIHFPLDPADNYAKWYAANKSKSPARWFVAALQAAGYQITFDGADLLAKGNLKAVPELVALLRQADDWFIRVQATNQLRELTGTDCGQVRPATKRATLDVIAQAWLAWLADQQKKEKTK